MSSSSRCLRQAREAPREPARPLAHHRLTALRRAEGRATDKPTPRSTVATRPVSLARHRTGAVNGPSSSPRHLQPHWLGPGEQSNPEAGTFLGGWTLPPRTDERSHCPPPNSDSPTPCLLGLRGPGSAPGDANNPTAEDDVAETSCAELVHEAGQRHPRRRPGSRRVPQRIARP